MHSNVHCSIIYNSQTWKQLVSNIGEWLKKMRYICMMKYYSAIKIMRFCPLGQHD